MRSGTFLERKSVIGEGTAALLWKFSLCFSYHDKLKGDSEMATHLIWMQWLYTRSRHGPLAPKREYRSTSLLRGQYDELANLYLAICTYGGRCKKREVRPERSRLSRSCQQQREMISAHTASGDDFHEISSRSRKTKKGIAILSPSNSMLWSYAGPLSA